MGVRILHDDTQGMAALYCSTSDSAFGPIISKGEDHDAQERAEAFLTWLPLDARQYEDADLEMMWSAFTRQEAMWFSQLEHAEDCWECGETAYWLPDASVYCPACAREPREKAKTGDLTEHLIARRARPEAP